MIRVPVIILILVTAIPLVSADPARVCVTGSPRGVLLDIEDRILREEISRRIEIKGLRCVSVMDLEREIHEKNLDIRALSARDSILLAGKTSSDYIFTWSVSGKQAPLFILELFSPAGKRLFTREIPLDKITPVQSQWQTIAETAAAEVQAYLTSLR